MIPCGRGSLALHQYPLATLADGAKQCYAAFSEALPFSRRLRAISISPWNSRCCDCAVGNRSRL